jgi:hypothetical protein
MTKKKEKKRSHHKKPDSKVKRIPRQKVLPGIGDAKIAAIENAALDYAEIRDKRQALSADESSLKKELLNLMHKSGKTEYKRNGISIKVVVEEETVKVRVREEGELETPEPEVEVNADAEPPEAA